MGYRAPGQPGGVGRGARDGAEQAGPTSATSASDGRAPEPAPAPPPRAELVAEPKIDVPAGPPEAPLVESVACATVAAAVATLRDIPDPA